MCANNVQMARRASGRREGPDQHTRGADDASGSGLATGPGPTRHPSWEAAGLGPLHSCTREHFLTSWDKVDKNQDVLLRKKLLWPFLSLSRSRAV